VRRPFLVLGLATSPVAFSLAVLACGASDDVPLSNAPDGSSSDVAPRVDAATDAAEPTPCTIVDIPVGQGEAFCDLPGADATDVQVPPEFCVREFTTTPVPEARVLKFAPNGDLFVAAPSMATVGGATGGPGAIVVLPDDDGDGRADGVLTYAGPSPGDGRPCGALEAEDPENLACVHGLLFSGTHVYFTRSDEVRRFPYSPGDRAATAPSELVATLGGTAVPDVRWTHTLEQVKDGSLYVSRGRGDSSACSLEEMSRGAVFALHVEGDPPLPVVPELVADGLRNPMYLRCSPSSCGDCYASELTGDDWGGVGGREKLALLGKKGESWGYPCCITQGIPHPESGPHNCANVGREIVAIPLHDTNFGLDFDRGGFPEPYRHGVFIALHGVFTSFGGTGVIWLPTDPVTLRPTGEPQKFARGFVPDGRATDVVFAPDGRLFIADDTSGKIYWVAPRTLRAPR
jgi:glucose/arabinose dehydrogenase